MPEGLEGLQDEQGRLWDIAWMLRHGIRSSASAGDEIQFKLLVQNDLEGPKEITLKALCGPGDDFKPAITVMLPEED